MSPRLFKKKYIPSSASHRMSHVGDIVFSRDHYYRNRPSNLTFLLSKRYAWMNAFISQAMSGIEVGAGAGFSKDYIQAKEFKLTDTVRHPWIDQVADALSMPFSDSSLDFIIASNMIHHLSQPYRFLKECSRVLRPGGCLIIQEVNNSLLMRTVIHLMRSEGYDYDADVFNENTLCNDPDDPWSANNAIPNLLFDDVEKCERHFPFFKVIHHRHTECLIFLISGGVTAKTKTINLPRACLRFIELIDRFLIGLSKEVFALQKQIVLVNRKNS